MTKVLILGKDGMLGSMVTRILQENTDLIVKAFGRDELDASLPYGFDIDADWVINCIGIVKPYIKDDAETAIRVNSLFPHLIHCENIIQIATDCVYSGEDITRQGYVETDEHDPRDIYGKTKSLGEVHADNFYNIRTSIIGPQNDKNALRSLMQWFLELPEGSEIQGYTSHLWNGVTTEAFARVCMGIIIGEKPDVNNFHLIPDDDVNKYQLLTIMADVFDRTDIKITPVFSSVCNRKLATLYPENNVKMWLQAGYYEVPMIKHLINSLKKFV